MTLPPGSRLGPYVVEELLGVGGMGEVYKARDSRLDRPVAIKLLKREFVERVDRRERFRLEARAISSLSHPHICTLFDVGETIPTNPESPIPKPGSVSFLVMEYLEGETLDDRLVRGALPAADVMRYATQMADALDHAHGKGIFHRDIKPSNVMLTTSGVKILDFGLARGAVLAEEPALTISSPERRTLTAEGTIVGTLQYMAPEQLEGRPADARTDIYAFGALLYEIATGTPAGQPRPLSSVRLERQGDPLPPALDHIVSRCLANNPDERWQTMRDLKWELAWAATAPVSRTEAGPPSPRTTARRALPWALALAGVVASVVLLNRPDPAIRTTRFTVLPPAGTIIDVPLNRTRFAISPDGRQLTFVAAQDGREQLWVRSLDSFEARPLAGTDGASSPFWSPDNRFIGFYAQDLGEIRKVDVAGGPPRTICQAEMDGAATWGVDGTILFTQYRDGIYRVAAEGGTPVRVTARDQRDTERREMNHYWPSFLPDGRRFLYTATARDANGLRTTPSVYMASLDSTEVTLVARLHSKMVYAAPGYVLFVQDGALLAQKFDTATAKLSGEAIRIADEVGYHRLLGNAGFSASNDVLAYQGGWPQFRLSWYDREGRSAPIAWEPQSFGRLRLSPDGKYVAIDLVLAKTGLSDIWTYDLSRGIPSRVEIAGGLDQGSPVWSPDGRRLIFRDSRGGAPALFAKTLDGGEELLLRESGPLTPEDWSLDGRWIAYSSNTRMTGGDIWLLPLSGDRTPRRFVSTRAGEEGARFSPDSRWLAFTSTELTTPEVFVAPVGRAGDKMRISVGGGRAPRWRRDGRELFYIAADRRSIMAVTVDTQSRFTAGIPRRLFTMDGEAASYLREIAFDVTPDGRRFLVSHAVGEPPSSRLHLVMNWTAALQP